jgi:tetratricopeptide (TPR) repeat protein
VRSYSDELRRAQGVEVQIRVGLNSGEVVVRSVGSDLRMDYTAVGQTTHLAARMEQLATPGTVRLTGETLRLAEGYVEVRSLGPIPVKGLPDPIEIFELMGAGQARTRLQAAALRGFTRFVGRGDEIEHLRRVLGQAGAGHGQVAAIVGEAGVGKSRLTYEFTHSHRVQDWLVLEASSVSYGKATSYLPVIDLLKGYFKIGDRDTHREMRDKVMGRVLGLDRALEPLLPPLLALLDVPVDDAAWQSLDPLQRRERTLDAVKRLLLRESQVQPLLVVFEDLHWIDGETQALLDSLVESLGSARLLLLANYRPEYQHGWASKTAYSQMRLDPLVAESAAELLDALLGDEPGLAPIKQLLVKRGNPFFLEETVRTLVETKALEGSRGRYRLTQPLQALQVPSTVQTILAARIDRLSPEDKRLLQTASVVGKDVPSALLQAIAELPDEALRGGLDRLRAAEFLYESGLFPDLEYAFKHALTHEVTYGTLLQERRRTLHAQLVGAIERIHTDRLSEQIERLADHALRGELREKAVDYLRQAGRKAAARGTLRDARAWFEQALGALEAVPENQATLEQAFEVRLELRPVLSQLGEARPMLERLREAETLAEQLNDDRRRGRVCAFMANLHGQLGEPDEALASGTRALEIAGQLGDLRLRILATSYLGDAHYFHGEYERVVELATDNLAALPADWVYESFGVIVPPSVYDRCRLVVSLAELGRFAEAAERDAEAIVLAEPYHHSATIGWTHLGAARVHLLKGDWAKAHSRIEQGIAVLRSGNVLVYLPGAVAHSAWALAQVGEASEALNRVREGEQLVERRAARGFGAHAAYHALGRACLLLGRLDEARRLGHLAIESSPRHPGFAAHALHLLGDIATHLDWFDAESGEAHYRQALTLAEPRGMRPLVAHCHLGLGHLSRRTGNHAQAREHLTTATTMYREMDMRYWLSQAEQAMAARNEPYWKYTEEDLGG